MKRCPECEFIYEDEQTICDMDGTTLALDAHGATNSIVQRSTFRSVAVPAIVGTVLAALLFLVFIASPLSLANPDARTRPQENQTVPASIPEPSPIATQPVQEASPPPASPEESSDETRSEQVAMTSERNRKAALHSADNDRLTVRRGLPPLPRVPPLPRLNPAKVQTQTKSTKTDGNPVIQSNEREKRPSKVTSFLKKTGRIIKKPFKF